MYKKMIVYDRHSGDFALYLNGELVGFARTFIEGEDDLNKLIATLLAHA